MTTLYAILDTGTFGSIVHNVVSIDYSDPNNISYALIGAIPGFLDKYIVSATLDPISGRIFFTLSDSVSNTAVNNMYLYSVSLSNLSSVTPFCTNNTVYINLNPQTCYNPVDKLYYYAINNNPSGYNYTVNTIDTNGNITVTNINTSNIQNSSTGLQIFNNYVYASFRLNNSFTVYYAGISNNMTGSITSTINPEPPGYIWSVFDLHGIMWGVTEYYGSSPQGYSLYQLQCTTNGLPASDPFSSELVGNMPSNFENNLIQNMTLFTPSACIHGSSNVLLANKSEKQISDLTQSDIVLCPNDKQSKIKQIVPCWNNIPNDQSHLMIVFEKDSICENTPNERFAIDTNHPMCTIDEYLKYGNRALRCSRVFINGKTIYRDKIDNIHNSGLLEKNIRYDLILENSDVYIANNVVVKARLSFEFEQKGY